MLAADAHAVKRHLITEGTATLTSVEPLAAIIVADLGIRWSLDSGWAPGFSVYAGGETGCTREIYLASGPASGRTWEMDGVSWRAPLAFPRQAQA